MDKRVINTAQAASFILLGGSLAFVYSETLQLMVSQWWTNDMYSYAFLIPFIGAYMVWVRRREILNMQTEQHYWGGISVLFAGLVLLQMGYKAGVQVLCEMSLIVNIVGLVWLLFGSKLLKTLLFPIFYLLFMLPSWGLLTNHMQLPFQLFSAQIGTKLAELVGVPVYLQDTYITLPNIVLEVAKECSGLNYLIAVLALSSAAAHLYILGWPRKIVLVLGSLAIAIFSNGLRVGLISIFSYYELSGDLHGPLHIFQGIAISLVGYAAILVGIVLLSNKPIIPSPRDQGMPIATPSLQSNDGACLRVQYLSFAASGVLLLFGTYLMFSTPISLPLADDLSSFPYQIAEWKGGTAPSSFPVFRKLGVDSELSRSYHSKSGGKVDLYIAYYSYQRQGKELVNTDTIGLLEGTGSTHLVPVSGNQFISVRSVSQAHGNGTKLILYAYLVGDRVITNRYVAKIVTAWEVLMNGRTNGAIFLVTSDIEPDLDANRNLQEIKMFIQDAFPFITHATGQNVRSG